MTDVLDRYEVINDLLVIKWKRGDESYIPLKGLREACPCAECSGETDALGNLYMGYGRPKSDGGYSIARIKPVGYYALQFTWGDGHDAGIYRFEFLKELGDPSA
ncbi:MAG: DUF971 domain-containing protein [Candidatus Neomarinimicrobiota bacterium]|nr:DUF971 domain-containing protein [Candidatus Neomarinimicrobiota bacterium]